MPYNSNASWFWKHLTNRKERLQAQNKANQGWIFLTHINFYQLLACVIETLILSICICGVIFLHWGHLLMEDPGTCNYLWKNIFPSMLICKYSHQQKSNNGQNQQDKPWTSYPNWKHYDKCIRPLAMLELLQGKDSFPKREDFLKQPNESAASWGNHTLITLQKEENSYKWSEESSWEHHTLASW